MCYTGVCPYETYLGDGNCGCTRGGNPCPTEGMYCPQCGSEMMESLRPECVSGSHREIPIWYCEKCEYQEDM